MKKIRNWLIQVFKDAQKEAMAGIPYQVERAVVHSMFAHIGVDRMQKVLDKMKEKGIDYTSLADMYSITLRDNLASNNNDRMHAYYELLPKLDEYKKAFKLEEWEKENKKSEKV